MNIKPLYFNSWLFCLLLFSGCATGNYSLDPEYFYEWYDVSQGKITVSPDGFPITVRDTTTLFFTAPEGMQLSFAWGTTFSDAIKEACFYLKRGNSYALTVAPRKTGSSKLFVFAGPPGQMSLRSAMQIGLEVKSVSDIAFPQVFRSFNSSGVSPKAYYSGKARTSDELAWDFFVPDPDKRILAVLKKDGEPIKGATHVMPVPGGVRVRVRPPEPGNYSLDIFEGRSFNFKFDGLLSYSISVSGPPVSWEAFPDFLGREGYLPDLSPIIPGSKHLPEKVVTEKKQTPAKGGNTPRPGRKQRYDFAAIDLHARNASSADEQSIETLARYLAKKEFSDIEKFRSLFVWVTDRVAYDKKPWNPALDNDLELRISTQVLKGRKAVCEGYAALFHQLANAAGLNTTIVTGMARSGNGATESHAWNLAEIDGEHYLIDATWGAGFTWAHNGKFEKRLQENYFLADPSDLICSHFPDHPKWQILAKPVSKEAFEAGCK